jgi:hypothetical protein
MPFDADTPWEPPPEPEEEDETQRRKRELHARALKALGRIADALEVVTKINVAGSDAIPALNFKRIADALERLVAVAERTPERNLPPWYDDAPRGRPPGWTNGDPKGT